MKRRIICLLVLCLLVLSNTVFAASWVLAENVGLGISTYVDIDDVAQKDGILLFWYGFNDRGIWKIYKVEDSLTKLQYRNLEVYYFKNGKIDRQFMTPSAYRNDDGLKHEKEVALKYAKEATDIGSVPTPP